MARTKEFDVDDVIDKALDLFWANGYEATSIQDLVDHLGINRGSLYDTFGSKDDLYALAFDRYVTRGNQALAAILEPDDGTEVDQPIRDRLLTLLSATIDDPDGRGCFTVNTVCERNHTHAPSRAATAEALNGWRTAYRRVLDEAATRGELSPEHSPAVEAETLLVLTEGLRVMTKADTDRTALADVVNSALDRILPSTPTNTTLTTQPSKAPVPNA